MDTRSKPPEDAQKATWPSKNKPPTTPPEYCWIITKTFDPDDYKLVGLIGPHTCKLASEDIKTHKNGHKFRLLTDDREVVAEGVLVDISGTASGFEPLDDYGQGGLGCTIILLRRWGLERSMKTKALVLSYMPMFNYLDRTGDHLPSLGDVKAVDGPMTEELVNLATESKFDTHGCIWHLDDGGILQPTIIVSCREPSPAYRLDDAARFCGHLRYWTDNDPDPWFKIYYIVVDDSYSVVIRPNQTKSIERWKYASFLRSGNIVTDSDMEYAIIWKDIDVNCIHTRTIASAVDKLPKPGSQSSAYVVNRKYCSNPAIASAHMMKLGTFEVGQCTSEMYDRLREAVADHDRG